MKNKKLKLNNKVLKNQAQENKTQKTNTQEPIEMN